MTHGGKWVHKNLHQNLHKNLPGDESAAIIRTSWLHASADQLRTCGAMLASMASAAGKTDSSLWNRKESNESAG